MSITQVISQPPLLIKAINFEFLYLNKKHLAIISIISIITISFLSFLIKYNLFAYDNLINLSHKKIMQETVEYSSKFPFRSLNSNYTDNLISILNLEYFNKQTYEFINNITILNYYGQWENLYFKENKIESEVGNVEIGFKKRKNNFLYPILYTNGNHLKGIFLLKDYKYIDNYIKGNFSIPLDSNFQKDLKEVLENKEKRYFTVENKDSTIFFFSCTLLGTCDSFKFNQTTVTVDFILKEKELFDKFYGRFVSVFSEIKIKFREKEEKFKLDIKASIVYDHKYTIEVKNYSFILTLIGFIEMYFLAINIRSIKNNERKCRGMDIITVCISIITHALFFTIHFYLAITSEDDEVAFYYGTPAIVFFFMLSFLEIRTLFFVFKSRFSYLYETDIEMFRFRLYQCSFVFFFIIFNSLIFSKFIVNNFATCYFLFFATWGFQIFHSVKVGIRPPMNTGYFIVLSLSKIFIAIYLRGYPDNIFEIKPNPLQVCAVVFTILIEISVIFLQKYYGTKVIIPSFVKRVEYNYYNNEIVTEESINKISDCAICGMILENDVIQEEIYDNFFIKKFNKLMIITQCVRKINIYYNMVKVYFKKKKFMITPCNHVFHSWCLEKWMETKNECPYCKQKLPQVE